MPTQRTSNRDSSSSNKSEPEQHEQQAPNIQQTKPTDLPQNQLASSPRERKISQIQNEVQSVNQDHKAPKKQQKEEQSQAQTQAPNRYTLYRDNVNQKWNMKDFDISKAVEQFGKLDHYPELEDSDDESANGPQKQYQKKDEAQIRLKVVSSAKETTGLNKKTTYTISCKDKTGCFQITRFYNQFVILREKLLLRWPGCFIPSIPTKKFGNNPYELVLIRMKVLNNFLKYLCKVPEIYNNNECGIFFKHDGEYAITNGKLIEQELEKLKAHTNGQLLEKYREVFSSQIEDLTEEQQKIAISEIRQLQEELKSWKMDLSRYKEQVRSLIAAKDKYYMGMTRLSTVLLPEFESIVLDWINDDKFNRPSDLSVEGSKLPETKEGYLLNTEEYGIALKDAALSVRNYNQSLWLIYDIFKFQLKQTQAILQSIECYEFLVREMDYLNRNINLNKEQIESLDEKKTTLKIFMMGGSVQQKKARIFKQTEDFNEKLSVVKDLLNYVLNVLINSIDSFHNDRAEAYRKILAKSSCQELVLVKKLMDFHLFELETFRKKDLFNRKDNPKLEEEEIVQE